MFLFSELLLITVNHHPVLECQILSLAFPNANEKNICQFNPIFKFTLISLGFFVFFFFPSALGPKYIQAIVSSHLVVVEKKMKAQIFQGDMVICPECWETAACCGSLFTGIGLMNMNHHEDPTHLRKDIKIFHSTSTDLLPSTKSSSVIIRNCARPGDKMMNKSYFHLKRDEGL